MFGAAQGGYQVVILCHGRIRGETQKGGEGSPPLLEKQGTHTPPDSDAYDCVV